MISKVTIIRNITYNNHMTPNNSGNLSKNAKILMDYLTSNFGKKVISGMMDLTWRDTVDEADVVYEKTGKYPALMGFDFMHFDHERGSGTTQAERARDWFYGEYDFRSEYTGRRGGIVAFCWHWYAPSSNGQPAFYAHSDRLPETDFRIPYIAETDSLDETSSEYKYIISSMDKVCEKLLWLKNQGVPVLWRPLHEANGTWFWWGCGDKNGENRGKALIALWKLMVNHFNKKGLDNLIWVWSGQDEANYPGDQWVDIVGEDIYATTPEKTDTSSQKARFEFEKKVTGGKKIIALSENGTIPNIDEMIKDDAMWSWFMTWNDMKIDENERPVGDSFSDSNFFAGEHFNPREHTKKIFNHPAVITMENLDVDFER